MASFHELHQQLEMIHRRELEILRNEIRGLKEQLEQKGKLGLEHTPLLQELAVPAPGDPSKHEAPNSMAEPTKPVPHTAHNRPSWLLAGGSSSLQERRRCHRRTNAFTQADVIGPEGHRLAHFVLSSTFEATFVFLICLNAIVMAFEVQYKGIDVEASLNYRGASLNADTTWPGAHEAFEVLDWTFGILFTLELCLKAVVLKSKFCADAWNLIDTVVVIAWIVGRAFQGMLPVNSRVLRMIRLARLVRTLRLVRRISTFDSLYLMIASIRGSVTMLFWTIMLLFLTHMFLALVLSQILAETYFNSSPSPQTMDEMIEIYKYFGTFTRSLFSMFELTLANWPPISRALSEYVSQWFMAFVLMHKLTLGFAILGVINGVFMQETFKVAALDDELITRQKKRAKRAHREKMMFFFEQADKSKDDLVCLSEFQEIMKDAEFKTWLSAMEFDVSPSDVNEIFDIIDQNDSDGVCADELVAGVARLKGQAKSIDAVRTLREIRELKNMIIDMTAGSVTMNLAERRRALDKELPAEVTDLESASKLEDIQLTGEAQQTRAVSNTSEDSSGMLVSKPKKWKTQKLRKTNPLGAMKESSEAVTPAPQTLGAHPYGDTE